MRDNMVSVVVPSYNYEKYIEECLESIASQEYKMIELIIIDDFSKDNSVDVIKAFIDKYRQKKRFYDIKFLRHNQNQGAHYTINEGIQAATGKYIAVINADDLYEKNRFAVMISEMIRGNKQIAFSNIEVIDNKSDLAQGEEAENFRAIQKRIDECGEVWKALMIQNVAISTGNMIFTKELYKQLKGFRKYKYIHDWDFILRATLIEEPLYVQGTKYLYRLHETNSFRELGNIADQEVQEVLTEFFGQIRNNKAININLKKDNVRRTIYNTYLERYLEDKGSIKQWVKRVILSIKKRGKDNYSEKYNENM